MNKKVIIIVVVVVAILVAIGVIHFSRDVYRIDMPSIDQIGSIELKSSSIDRNIDNREDIEAIVNILGNLSTRRESVSDYPNNSESMITILIKSRPIYVYKLRGRYYIEQPYNGIYRISYRTYREINTYLKTARLIAY